MNQDSHFCSLVVLRYLEIAKKMAKLLTFLPWLRQKEGREEEGWKREWEEEDKNI